MLRASALVSVGLCALLSPGCGLLPLGGSPTAEPGGKPSPSAPGIKEFRAVFHCHSYLSHDSEGTIEEIAAAARALGIDVVCLTDHYEEGNIARSPRGIHGGVLFIPGIERRLRGGGSLLAAGVKEDFPKRIPEEKLLEELRRQGAFLVAGHVEAIPEDRELRDFGGFEIYNLHAQFKEASIPWVALKLLVLPIDSFFETSIETPAENLRRWDRRLARGERLCPLLGHDAHQNVRLFGPLGGTVGTYPELFRLFSTRILAPELTEEAVLGALRRGHTIAVFDFLGDAAGFQCRYGPLSEEEATGLRGSSWAIPGDAVRLVPGAAIEVVVPEAAQVRVLREGRVLREVDACAGRALVFVPEGPGIYRVEVYRAERLWILPAPFYLRGTEGPAALRAPGTPDDRRAGRPGGDLRGVQGGGGPGDFR